MSGYRLLVATAACLAVLTLSAAPGAALEIGEAELVSVGLDWVTLSWTTDEPCAGSVRYGFSSADYDQVYEEADSAIYHRADIRGLNSGIAYSYEIRCGGQTAALDELSPGWFQTLNEPGGEFLFRFGTLNDMHIGESTAGLLQLGPIVLTPGFTWPDPQNPYWLFSNAAALNGASDAGAELLVIKGDLTSNSWAEEYQAYLDLTAGYPLPIWELRGNHDRPGEDGDLFLSMLGLESSNRSFEYQGVKFILLDSVDPLSGAPSLSNQTMTFLISQLQSAPDTPTLIFLHHAVRVPAWGLGQDAEKLLALIDEHPQVLAVLSGHSHRAAVDPYLTADGRVVPLIETPSTKEYPLGYTIYDVYTQGFVQTFHRSDCEDCRAWQHITREEYFGLAPTILLGPLEARCFTHRFDQPIEGGGDDDDAEPPPAPDIPPTTMDLDQGDRVCGGL
ncbi:MAG: metallophosphoesterase family protein [Candidatus Alcyoniella australis]|nr:metallophosphoesterase family protein [Candidatus Alcyoniella australis]